MVISAANALIGREIVAASIVRNNPLAYREQSLAMGEKIDFTRDSVYTVPAKIANDENNNSLLSNIDFRRDTMEGRYSITTQGPRFSDADLSPKDPARCGALGGLETIEEGQEDSRGSAYEKIMSLPPLLPKASLIGSNIGPLASRIDHGDDELEAKRRKMSQALSCADADDDEVYRPSLTMARALQKYHSFGHVYSNVEESQPESEVEGGQECEEPEVAEETGEEVGAGDNQNDSGSKTEGESPTVNPSPPNTVTASPQHIPSPPPPAPTAKGSPPIGLPLIMGKGKAPPPPLAVGKGKAPFPSPPGMKNGKSPLPLKAPIKMGPPVAPLRPLFWTSVPMGPRERLENNFWKSVKQNCKMIDEDTIPWCAEFVREDELQTMFGQNASKVAGKSVGNRSVAAPPRHGRKVLKLLDDKRSHMLAIAFRPLPEPDELVKIIASGNVAALTGTQLSMLADEVPTPDFVEELAAMETRSLQEGVQTNLINLED
ncbi:hypothetical protein Pmar_PMAR019935 [Perkinsus marinus ATCC 50983]|uniref:FH2 domain-containing protein n=1 Tax=Perkinsus marinus (strain ATCC 50983 / TXsc) TaxID=423536 RepID=C5KC21_PERM5|nr:hypothetical protein Pmar_PMAR019935 [Perkinsus marinus ATCC 50983]EER18052.1 hypothetical protein Pmar_PMAR019935 [Perkinsus marinus ATCC 50983]|eukprot:XP_002786256.1 hypothetical protein Pmar_PMAR019935 [Perkinsus marinus ATCC 50983]